jgi:hypothetical protein
VAFTAPLGVADSVKQLTGLAPEQISSRVTATARISPMRLPSRC